MARFALIRSVRPAAAALALLALAGCGRPALPGETPAARSAGGADAAPAAAAAPPAASLRVYYSASLTGNLDGCTCEHNPTAGLVKRAAFLRALPPAERSLRLDAGDLIGVYPDADLAARILASYREIGYTAAALGEQELALGAAALGAYAGADPGARAAAPPLLAHNLRLRLQGRWVAFGARPLFVDSGGRRVAVFALLEPGLMRVVPRAARRGFRLSPPEKTAREMVRLAAQGGADLTVLLYHGTEAGLRRLLRAVPRVDLAVLGHEGRLVDAVRVEGTLVVSPGDQGNRLGILDLPAGRGPPGEGAAQGATPGNASALRAESPETRSVSSAQSAAGRPSPQNRFRLFSFRSDPDDPAIRERIQAYNEILRDRLKRAAAD